MALFPLFAAALAAAAPAPAALYRDKPTNHYVINDVQYAKISRNLQQAQRADQCV